MRFQKHGFRARLIASCPCAFHRDGRQLGQFGRGERRDWPFKRDLVQAMIGPGAGGCGLPGFVKILDPLQKARVASLALA